MGFLDGASPKWKWPLRHLYHCRVCLSCAIYFHIGVTDSLPKGDIYSVRELDQETLDVLHLRLEELYMFAVLIPIFSNRNQLSSPGISVPQNFCPYLSHAHLIPKVSKKPTLKKTGFTSMSLATILSDILTFLASFLGDEHMTWQDTGPPRDLLGVPASFSFRS